MGLIKGLKLWHNFDWSGAAPVPRPPVPRHRGTRARVHEVDLIPDMLVYPGASGVGVERRNVSPFIRSP